ncbi:MAG TPA: elongation factor P [Candidatus Paceibacterota bacterium]
MLSYTDLTKGTVFVMDGQPYVVLEYAFLRMQQRRPTSRVKVRNLITGKTGEYTFQQSDSFAEAEIAKEPLTFLYARRGEYWFVDPKDAKRRIKFSEEQIGEQTKYFKPNIQVTAYVFDSQIVNIEIPIKVDYEVKEAPPSYKGDTATGSSKTVVLDNDLSINVPMFINQGDVIRVNTETGAYTERITKQ